MRITSPALRLLALLTLPACAHGMHHGPSEGPTITASGDGKASGAPDQALIVVAALAESKDASTAAGESARVATQIIEAAKAIVGGQGSVRTTAYSLNPVYDFIDGKQSMRAYQARNAITVELWATKDVGAVIDGAVKAGALEVSSITFGVRDNAKLRQAAIAQASQAAMREATAAAQALGLRVGKVRTIAVGSSSGVVPMPMAKFARADMAQSATPVEAGAVDVTASVSIEAHLEK
ncbi:MAG: SIMPL domain-containing protein [Deltaproteobacteria bacterium]|nr:SIMPL domain-containing protein [Deltaproteobacteria bacterium]